MSKDIDFSKKINKTFLAKKEVQLNYIDNLMTCLSSKCKAHNNQAYPFTVNLTQLKEVFKRGVHDAMRLEKPTSLWAVARVNTFLKMARGAVVSNSYRKIDRDVLNDPTFFIDDGIRDDIIFTYEEISEARFDSENFNLNSFEDFDFVDKEEFLLTNFSSKDLD